MRRIGLVWRTVKQLTIRQLVFQVVNRLRNRPRLRIPDRVPLAYFLTVPDADKPTSWKAETFTFLNKSYSPGSALIDWNYRNARSADYGRLWTYNLNYFDFLNQPDLSLETGLSLIQDFIAQTNSLGDGLEPYPSSLRIINWVQFLSRHQVQNQAINCHLFAQVNVLSRRIEYHIAGNHLLENGYALLIGSLYFRHKGWFRKASQLLYAELDTQILPDGGHDERSPMYHQLLLDRMLTVITALQADAWHADLAFVDFLSNKARKMLGWLNDVTFANGDVPMVNDSAFGIAPTTAQLKVKAKRVLGEGFVQKTQLNNSGYRMFRTPAYELFADVGAVGPDHQPGHAHADTFSFILYVNNGPILVDTGTSTYQPGPRRYWERSTSAHNTVEVGKQNSSEVWSGFRVGRRAKVAVLTDTSTELKAQHDGYRHIGVTHERSWLLEQKHLTIKDRLIRTRHRGTLTGVARFHFYFGVDVQRMGDVIKAGPVLLSFSSETKPSLCVRSYDMTKGFNQFRTARCLEVRFADSLETTINCIK